MKREVFFDFSKDPQGVSGYQFGGYELEHEATRLCVALPSRFLGEEVRFIHFDFQTPLGETIATQPVDLQDGRVSVALFQQLMQEGILQFQVVGRSANDEVIAKTAMGKLVIQKSTYGDPVVIDEQPYRVDSDILACLANAQQAANEAEASLQAFLAQLPLGGESIADGSIDLEHFSEQNYRLFRQMSMIYSGEGTLKGVIGSGSTDIAAQYIIGEVVGGLPASNPTTQATIYLFGAGKQYGVVAVDGSPVMYKDIPTYGLYHIKSDTEILLVDGRVDTSVKDGSVTTDKLVDGTVSMDKLSEEVKAAISGAVKRSIVMALPDVASADTHTIYMVTADEAAENNVYNEFMAVDGAWEQIGSTAVDLTGYATKEELTDGSLFVKYAEYANSAVSAMSSQNAENANYAGAAGFADQAMNDYLGNNINETYASKEELDAKPTGVMPFLGLGIVGASLWGDGGAFDLTLATNTMTEINNDEHSDVNITLAAPVSGYDNEWGVTIPVGDTPYTVSFAEPVHWGLGIAPTFAANTTTVCRFYYVGDTLCGEWVSV